MDSARRNLYTLLSILRNSLASSSGECPYLVRAYNGYMLDDRLVSCDADRVNRLCRGFADPSHGAEALNALLDEFKLVYTGNLMPSETKNEAILAERDAYRLKAVDGMLTAVAHLLELQEEPSALRFARSALDLDDSREDVYIAIMRCQLALGQRTPALQTYLSCRRHLTEHLGIDPSARAVRLYRSIIEEEADFD